jgi:glycosyltransferase 2 family protein
LNWKFWIGVLISAVLLAWAVHDVNPQAVWTHIQTVNPIYFVPYLALVAIEVVLRAWKWYVLLTPVKRASFRNLNAATLIGLMANNVLPARAGEFVRAYVGARMERIPFSASLATVVIDRVLDGLTVSAIFVLTILLLPELPDQVKAAGYLAAGIYVFALAFLLTLLVKEALAFGLMNAVLRFFPHRFGEFVNRIVRAFVGGLGALKDVRLFGLSIFISVLIWLGYALSVFIMGLAMDINLTVFQSFVVLLIVTILLTLPSTPGFLGAMELGIKLGLVLFGIDESRALAFALVYHVTQYIPITLAGLAVLWLERIGMREISHVPAADAAAADPA